MDTNKTNEILPSQRMSTKKYPLVAFDQWGVLRLTPVNPEREAKDLSEDRPTDEEQNPFNSPAWKNKWSRSAILCLLAVLPVSVLCQIVSFWWLSAIGIGLCAATLVLVIIALKTAKPDVTALSDQQLMRLEMDQFSDILAHEQAGISVPTDLNKRHTATLNECVRRGFTAIETGGWKEYQVQ